MIFHSKDKKDLETLPGYYLQSGREKGAAVGVYLSGENLRFCFVFRAFGFLEMATMPFEDNPGDFLKVCQSIKRRLGRDKTAQLMGQGLQWIKRSRLSVFPLMVANEKYTNTDWAFYDSVIYVEDLSNGVKPTEYQRELHEQFLPNLPGGYLTRRALTLKTRLANKILRIRKDPRLLHLMDKLSEAGAYFRTHSGKDDQTAEFALNMGIIQNARQLIDTNPDEWYQQFCQIVGEYKPQKNEFA